MTGTGNRKRQVIDAFIFSIELDLLEIRMRELEKVVDKFVILESNATFTGKPKPAVFEMNRDRYNFIAPDRIIHRVAELHALPAGESPFRNEMASRGALDGLLRSELVGIQDGDLVIMSDVDEIVSAETVRLLKTCDGYPDSLHLELKNYLYSFEFSDNTVTWRPHIETWRSGRTFFHHTRLFNDELMLADAGWHCSFCFRYIEDFIFKMQAYSHNDRVRHPGLLDPERIQRTSCNGEDIFGMYPEVYSYRDLIWFSAPIPKATTTRGLPSYLVSHPQQFKFLLPGGCMRERSPKTPLYT